MPDRGREELRKPLPMRVVSPAFADGERIPARFTADGDDLSPPLHWSSPPEGTRSLAIVCDDADVAPSGLFVHWLAWNIRPDRDHFDEGVPPISESPDICQGQNGFGMHGYSGPNPPKGERHKYAFRVYALDCKLDLPGDATRVDLDEAMNGHVLGTGTLTARYDH